MDIERIRWKNERPYVPYIVLSGKRKGLVVRMYGKIKTCLNCKKEFMAFNNKLLHGGGKFCNPKCSNSYHPDIFNINSRWKGGRRGNGKGYTRIMVDNHPNSDERGYVWEHRIVVEKSIKRFLTKDEVIHHKDCNPTNNHIDNLCVMLKGDHMAMHRKMKRA